MKHLIIAQPITAKVQPWPYSQREDCYYLLDLTISKCVLMLIICICCLLLKKKMYLNCVYLGITINIWVFRKMMIPCQNMLWYWHHTQMLFFMFIMSIVSRLFNSIATTKKCDQATIWTRIMCLSFVPLIRTGAIKRSHIRKKTVCFQKLDHPESMFLQSSFIFL